MCLPPSVGLTIDSRLVKKQTPCHEEAREIVDERARVGGPGRVPRRNPRFTLKPWGAARVGSGSIDAFQAGTQFRSETHARRKSMRKVASPRGRRDSRVARRLPRRVDWLKRRTCMPVPLVLTFVSMVAFAIQLLIFAYLYSSHRVRFFQYLLLAWGAYTLSKGLEARGRAGARDSAPSSFVTEVAPIAAVGFTLAAAFAYRWDYRLSARDVLAGIGARGGAGLRRRLGRRDEGQRIVGVGLGLVQIAAGVLFWPPRGRGTRVPRRAAPGRPAHALGRPPHRDAVRERGGGLDRVHGGARHLHHALLPLHLRGDHHGAGAGAQRERAAARAACARPSAWPPRASWPPAWPTRSATRSRPSSTPPRSSPTRRGLTPAERAATLGAVRTEARRLNRILSDFLRFARPQAARRAPGDIAEVVEHVGALVREDRPARPAWTCAWRSTRRCRTSRSTATRSPRCSGTWPSTAWRPWTDAGASRWRWRAERRRGPGRQRHRPRHPPRAPAARVRAVLLR